MQKKGDMYMLWPVPGVLYIGVTSELTQRVWQHKTGVYDGFSKKCKCHTLVYFERFESIEKDIMREKELKNWKGDWKLKLIRKGNRNLVDLFFQIRGFDMCVKP